MRTTNQIIIAVKDNEPVEKEELRLALLAVVGMNHYHEVHIGDLVDSIEEGTPMQAKLRAGFAKTWRESAFKAEKTPPDKWLGPQNIPGNPEYDQRMGMYKKIFKKATGLDI